MSQVRDPAQSILQAVLVGKDEEKGPENGKNARYDRPAASRL